MKNSKTCRTVQVVCHYGFSISNGCCCAKRHQFLTCFMATSDTSSAAHFLRHVLHSLNDCSDGKLETCRTVQVARHYGFSISNVCCCAKGHQFLACFMATSDTSSAARFLRHMLHSLTDCSDGKLKNMLNCASRAPLRFLNFKWMLFHEEASVSCVLYGVTSNTSFMCFTRFDST